MSTLPEAPIAAQRGVIFTKQSDAERAAPNADGSAKLYNFGGGLVLRVSKTTKSWRCKVQRDGREYTETLGHYPGMTLKQATLARATVKNARNPGQDRIDAKAQAKVAGELTFGVAAQEWIDAKSSTWSAERARVMAYRVRKHLLSAETGAGWAYRPITSIDKHIIEVLVKALERRLPAEAIQVKQCILSIFDEAVYNHEDILPASPARIAQHAKRLPSRKRRDETPQPRTETIEDARRVLAAFEVEAEGPGRPRSPSTILAHRLQALTGVRPGEAIGARWSEFSKPGLWVIPAARMKMRRDHVVPLAPQAQAVIAAMRGIRRCDEFVFPGLKRGQHGNRGTISERLKRALAREGLPDRFAVPHGWRGSLSTILNELHPHKAAVIEATLAHAVGGVAGRYNGAEHLDARRELLVEWANMLITPAAPSAFALAGLPEPDVLPELPAADAAKPQEATGNVVPLRRRAA